MIIDSINNFSKYISINHNFKDVLIFLEKTDLANLEEGKFDISDSVFAIVSNYKTKKKEDTFIEYHKKHIDIQIVINGSESVGYAAYENCKDIVFYDDKDYGILEGKLNYFNLEPSNFAIFFTFEGHAPQIDNGTDINVKKIVFKIK
ncbi:MAG TPA: YhcH/YjgK/YiaL family protein [Melioribacteraceae bacterium]|nr:YhcH/YjgK/YiaL family protein [Melioribacteraceae bacterium]